MNYFTKEDLQEIECALKEDLDKFGKPYHSDVMDKIQFMIDNYSEPITKRTKNNLTYSCSCLRCESKAIDICYTWYALQDGQHNVFLCVDCSLQFSVLIDEHFKRKYTPKNFTK